MRYFTSTLLLLILALPTFAAEQKILRVGVFTWAGNGLLHVGQERDFFGDVKVEIKVIDDATALINAFRSGEIDVMNNTLDGAALMAGNGTQAKALYATDNSFGGDGIVAVDDIQNVKDLKGKKVAFVQGIFQHFFLNHILEENCLTIDDIRPVKFDDPSMPAQALFSGKVDAAVAWEPYLTQAVQNKTGHIIATSKTYPGTYLNVWFINNATETEKADLLKTFIRGLLRAAEFIKDNKEDSAAIIAKGFGMKPQEVLDTMNVMYYLTPEQEAEYFCGKKPKAAAVFDEAAKFWVSQKLVKAKPGKGESHISKIGCGIFKAENKR